MQCSNCERLTSAMLLPCAVACMWARGARAAPPAAGGHATRPQEVYATLSEHGHGSAGT